MAAVTIVSYNGISRRAIEASLKSDLRNTAVKINLTKTDTGSYPLALTIAERVESDTTDLSYQSDGTTFCLSATTQTAGGPSFYITQDGNLLEGDCGTTAPTWAMVSAGRNHNLALTSDGTLYAWGDNQYGQLGDETTTDKAVPVPVSLGELAGKTIVQLSAGDYHSMALDSDGVMYAWGRNYNGQIGNGTASTANVMTPIAITGGGVAGKTVTQISAAGTNSYALTSDGKVYGWGVNASYNVGDGTTTQRAAPTAIAGAAASKTTTQLSAAYNHVLLLTSDGLVYAWGANNYGQVGLGTTSTTGTASSTVVTTATATNCLRNKTVSTVVAGMYFSLARMSDGTICGWGYGSHGQLNGTTSPVATPTAITGGGVLSAVQVTSVSAGGFTSAATVSGGGAYTWGRNNQGQIGNSTTTTPTTTPFLVSGAGELSGKSVASIYVGFEHALALTNEGELYSWGNNTDRRLGRGDAPSSPTAPGLVAVPGQ